MKRFADIITIGFAVIMTFGLFTYVGYRLDNLLVGILIGFVLSFAYLLHKIGLF